MIFKTLTLKNWKCFRTQKKFEFEKHQLLSMRNGTGKTSIFQAITFAIWGKAPTGFNLNTVRNDDSMPCEINLDFELANGDQCQIRRVFGSSKNVSTLTVNDQLVAESVRNIAEWMDARLNQNICNILWTETLVGNDILRENFISTVLTEDVLKEPLMLINHYKTFIYHTNRKINSFDEKILDLEAIAKRLEEIKRQLKGDGKGITEAQLSKARLAKEADEKLSQLPEIKSELTDELVAKYQRLKLQEENLRKRLVEEMAKSDSPFSNFSARELQKIVQWSENNQKCLICGGEFNQKHAERIRSEMKSMGRSEETIAKIQDDLKICNLDENDVKTFLEKKRLLQQVEACKNYLEIIEKYDGERNKLWAELESAQRDHQRALLQQEKIKEINQLKADVEAAIQKRNAIDGYVKDAKQKLTRNIMDKASEYMGNINDRYKQIALTDDGFVVVVEDETFTLNIIPVAQLSSGERTMLALSLVFAMHHLLTPELPLLFDETFSALDRENLEQVQDFLKKQDGQIFIITHDQNWREF